MLELDFFFSAGWLSGRIPLRTVSEASAKEVVFLGSILLTHPAENREARFEIFSVD
jgi:hypothetical protein